MRIRLQEDVPRAVALRCEYRDMPFDPGRWRDGVVRGDLPQADVRVLDVADTETSAGWPLVLVRSDRTTAAGVVSWLHGFYSLLDWACVVSVSGPADQVDAMRERLIGVAVDWPTDELVAITELWDAQ